MYGLHAPLGTSHNASDMDLIVTLTHNDHNAMLHHPTVLALPSELGDGALDDARP